MSFKALNKKDLTLLTSRRSQSALEYMMTYGWAILIIVIVAVILYSMGIFNPSSSVTFTSSGFSPFTVSASLCNNLGYKIAVLAGPIPNNANSITINKVFLTSAIGANTTTASYTLTSPVTLKSGQSATILIPNVACNSANIHYSLSAKIQYSYDVPTIGTQTVNTTGTMAGTSISGKPLTLTSYEPITITNTQSSATPNPFQQMVNFTSSDPGFSSIATGNFGQNVEFFYYNGTVIPSWLENYTSNHALWWLKIAAISAGSSETIYVGFAPTSTNLFNTVNDGEAPQLSCPNPSDTVSCSTYAEYDDGVNVFNNYWNFAGASLQSGWTYYNALPDNDNGLDFYRTQELISTTTTYPISDILEADVSYPHTTANDNMGFGYALNNSGGPYTNYGGWIEVGSDYYSGITENLGNDEDFVNVNDGSFSSFASTAPGIIGIVSTGTITYSYSSGNVYSSTGDVPPAGIYYIEIGDGGGSGLIVQWLRTRTYPPNGVMPSVSFGSVV